jgi:hypothetical protein
LNSLSDICDLGASSKLQAQLEQIAACICGKQLQLTSQAGGAEQAASELKATSNKEQGAGNKKQVTRKNSKKQQAKATSNTNSQA